MEAKNMKRHLCGMILIICCVCCVVSGLSEGHLSHEPTCGGEIVRIVEQKTLEFTIERLDYLGARCYLTRVWMQYPASQIEKGTSKWGKNIQFPSEQAKKLPVKAMLVTNGSGFISDKYPWIPEEYPGRGPDYYNTSWGSLVVTDRTVYRNLPGVKFYGIALETDGLHMYTGEDNDAVLAHDPIHTWSFYDRCALVRGEENLVDQSWQFSREKSARTVIGRLADDTVVILTVTQRSGDGLTLIECADFFLDRIHPLWAFNLDGGPSTALLVRPEPKGLLKTVYGNIVKSTDIIGFCE